MTATRREALSYVLMFFVFVFAVGASYMSARKSVEADLYRSAISIHPDAVVLVKVRADPHGTVDVWSKGAEKLLGWKAHEIEGKSISMIIPAIMRPRHNTKMAAAVKRRGLSGGATVQYVRCTAKHKDGREIPVVTNIRYQEEGGVQQFVGLIDPQDKVIMLDLDGE